MRIVNKPLQRRSTFVMDDLSQEPTKRTVEDARSDLNVAEMDAKANEAVNMVNLLVQEQLLSIRGRQLVLQQLEIVMELAKKGHDGCIKCLIDRCQSA